MTAPGLIGGPLDRSDRIRHDPEAFDRALRDPRARVLALDALDPRVGGDGRLAWRSLADTDPQSDLLLLGVDRGIPHFVEWRADSPAPPPRTPGTWHALGMMAPGEAETYAAARSLLEWHRRHGFCANCGTPTRIVRAGWGRTCPHCGAEHFPRADPVVIMLAVHDDRVLIGRSPNFPANHYSALAGFVEPGESLEQAVARELHEEAGIGVTAVRYVASQPWPFPHSLMIACMADAACDRLTIDTNELADAFWATRDEVRASLAGAADARFTTPPPFAIAHTLFTHWLGA